MSDVFYFLNTHKIGFEYKYIFPALQNRGIYMFRLDENTVIDATMAGNLARYVNHSCAPNCFAERFEIEREFKIVIVTNRRISRGEEVCAHILLDRVLMFCCC